MGYRSSSAWVLVALSTLFMLVATVGTAAEAALDQHLPGWKMARFLPDQGRLVLEHEGEMLVVRSGEEIPGLPGSLLKTIGPRGALLEIMGTTDLPDASQQQSRSWLLLKPKSDGLVDVISIRQMPEEGLQPEAPSETNAFPVYREPSTFKEAPVADDGKSQ